MTQLKSAMAGTVSTVEVTVGEEISVGQVVLILESMKMQIPIEAEVAGRVATIHVQAGDFVNDGDALVTFGE